MSRRPSLRPDGEGRCCVALWLAIAMHWFGHAGSSTRRMPAGGRRDLLLWRVDHDVGTRSSWVHQPRCIVLNARDAGLAVSVTPQAANADVVLRELRIASADPAKALAQIAAGLGDRK